MFGRVKPLDAILATAEKKSLHRSLGAFQLTMLGVGAIIGTGIFVLTAEAAQKAGPGMMLSFVIAGVVCAVAALCYAEMASMVPVSGSAYTYSYAVMGELLAWMVGWALVLEYAVAAGAVSVGWSGYFVGLLREYLGVALPPELVNANALIAHIQLAFGAAPSTELTTALEVGGYINLPAFVIALLVTWLLVIGTRESAVVNSILVVVKITALTAFVVLAIPVMNSENFEPFAPLGFGGIDLLRLRRVRCGFDRGRGDQEPAAQHADRADRQPGDLHGVLLAGCRRRDRDCRRRPAARRGRKGHQPWRRDRDGRGLRAGRQ